MYRRYGPLARANPTAMSATPTAQSTRLTTPNG